MTSREEWFMVKYTWDLTTLQGLNDNKIDVHVYMYLNETTKIIDRLSLSKFILLGYG